MSFASSVPFRVAVLYLAIALPWVMGTDLLISALSPSAEIEAMIARVKGAGFVIVTTVVLWVALQRWTRSLTRARAAAEASEARLASFLSTIEDLILITDLDQRIVEVIGPATTPADRLRFVGKRAPELFGTEAGEAFLALGARAMAGDMVELDWSAATSPITFPVSPRVTSMHITLASLRGADGQVTGLVGIGRDTSPLREVEAERERAERHIEVLRDSDPLTGLANRSFLERRLLDAVAEDAEQRMALHVVNLDRFRDVNDSLGYDVGDELLSAVARRLEEYRGPGDTLARISADDFVLAQVGVRDAVDAYERAASLVGAFEQPFTVHGYELRHTASAGLALYPENAHSPLDLLRAADAAMYTAKSDPVARWKAYEPIMATAASSRLQMANELRAAVERGEISVAYQPIVRAGDGRVLAFEALARWTSPTTGPVSPAAFIPVAERVGLIDDLGRSVRLQAYEWLNRAHAEGFTDLQMEVNVSPRHFLRGSVDRLIEEVETAGVEPRYIVLEITESALVEFGDRTLELLHELTRRGFALAVDDFGTGYSSLSYLARLPVSVVKVAQELTRGAIAEPSTGVTRVVLETTIQMSRRLGYQTIAEGVEDAAMASYLDSVGIDAHQGYFFRRPAPPDAALDYLRYTGTPEHAPTL